MVDQTEPSPPAECEVTPENLAGLEKTRRLLFEDDYVPDSVLEERYPEGFEAARKRRVPGWEPRLSEKERVNSALNNFLYFFKGNNHGMDPRKILQEHPEISTKLIRPQSSKTLGEHHSDIDEIVEELGLDTEIEFDRHEIEDGDRYSIGMGRYVYPVFEKLVMEKGYDVEDLRT